MFIGRDDTVHNRIPARGRDIVESDYLLLRTYSPFTISLQLEEYSGKRV